MWTFYVLAYLESASELQKTTRGYMTYGLQSSILPQKHGTLLAYVI